MVGDGPLYRLPDPPRRVRRKLEAATPVELLDGTVEPERPLLDQIQKRHSQTAIALRDRDDKAKVRLDHAALGDRVAAFDDLDGKVVLIAGGRNKGLDLSVLRPLAPRLRAVVAMGEAAGVTAALAALSKRLPHDITWTESEAKLKAMGQRV